MANRKSGESERSDYPQYTLNDLKRHKMDPHQWIMGCGFMKRGAPTQFNGPTGMGKSVAVVQCACCLAGGKDFLGIKVHRPVKVLLIEAENDVDVLKRDVLSIVKHLKLDESLIQKNLIIQHVYGMTDVMFLDYLEEQLKKIGPDVVILDPYQSFTTGDLNNTASFDAWKIFVTHTLADYKVAMLYVTHTGKPKDTKDWDIRELVYLQMGTSQQANWARASMELRLVKGDMRRFTLTFSKNPGTTGLKDKEGYPIRMVQVEHSHDPNEPFWVTSEDQSPNLRVGQYDGAIKKLLVKEPKMSARSMAVRVGCSPTTAAKIMEQLKEDVKSKKK